MPESVSSRKSRNFIPQPHLVCVMSGHGDEGIAEEGGLDDVAEDRGSTVVGDGDGGQPSKGKQKECCDHGLIGKC